MDEHAPTAPRAAPPNEPPHDAAELLAELEAILLCVPHGVLVYDAEGQLARSNAAADAILGYSPDERTAPIEQRVASARHAWLTEDGRPLAPEETPAIRAARHGETHRGVLLRLRRRGAPDAFVSVSAAPLVFRGRTSGAVVSLVDETPRKRAEDGLRESEERLRALVTASSDVIYRVSPDWDEMRELHGRQLLADTDAPTTSWLAKYVHPDDQARVRAAVDEAIRTRSIYALEHRVPLVDGTIGWVLSRAVPVLDPSGRIVEWFGAASDITDRKRSEDALRRSVQEFRQLADTMPQLVWTTRPDGGTEYYNRQWCEYTGTTLGDAQGDSWSRILHPHDLARTMERWHHSLATGEPYEIEYRLRRARDGAYRWFLSRARPIRDGDGRIVRWFGTSTDIDEQKRVQTELERTDRALRESEDRLRAADRRKDEFLGMLSHELRNPLAPIANALHILERAEPGGAQARRAKEVARRQLAHISRIVDDLLDVTRIARGKIQLRRAEADLTGIVRRTVDDHRALLQDRGIALAVALPATAVPVDADETRLAQVLGNLLQNAAKFTPAGGQVSVSLEAGDGRAVLRVADTGAGIPVELQASVFEPFVQAAQTLARSEGGLGLGLALVKGLVALHGGEVGVTSAGPGRGAEFVVTLPTSGPRASPEEPAPMRAGAGHRLRVLVVDDNRDAAESLAEVVELFGHDAETAFDGPSAVAKATARLPHVVLCDIGLPGMDGYAVARALRAAHGGALRLVAVSGYAQPEDVRAALEAGFDAHVAKPPDPAAIEALLAAGPAAG